MVGKTGHVSEAARRGQGAGRDGGVLFLARVNAAGKNPLTKLAIPSV
jgi:hypothetical protein